MHLVFCQIVAPTPVGTGPRNCQLAKHPHITHAPDPTDSERSRLISTVSIKHQCGGSRQRLYFAEESEYALVILCFD
jgi:hypothetical protein